MQNKLSEIIQKTIDRFTNMLYTISPGRIVSLNIENDKIVSVNVRPSVNTIYTDGVSTKRPIIENVPVVFPSGGGGILSFPLKVNDPILIGFCREDIQAWLYEGDDGDPDTMRRFSQTDSVAIPCLAPFNESLGVSDTDVVLKFEGSSLTITPDGDISFIANRNYLVEVSGGVSIKNGSVELIAFLEDLCSELASTTVTIPAKSITTDDGASGPNIPLILPIDNKTSIESLGSLIAKLKA